MSFTREKIYAALRRADLPRSFDVKEAWAVIEPLSLTTNPEAMRLQLSQLCKGEAPLAKKTVVPASEAKSGRKTAMFELLPRVEEPKAPTPTPTPPPTPAVTEPGAEPRLLKLFTTVRDALRQHDIVAFSIGEDGSVTYEQRIVRKRTIELP